ncbi:NDK-domain-containing protein [Fimicolochytrium jonesii]|uniref:NDK-domain-containing protein n=1 Tax=Fimicolochytrium jonesii TaxID=1396493 RepID=UPI0022FDFEF9|nr:NDK-domain-containing protein [Fimicolochytrium jonesii]KAI8816056.1 NDK-domain-containing protein [Fimicolochytrium jonesii]
MFTRPVLRTRQPLLRTLTTTTATSTRRPPTSALLALSAGALALSGYILAAPNKPIHADAPKKPAAAAPPKSAAGVKGGIERTFIAVKPDGTQRRLVGEIVKRFETKGYKLVAIKATVPSKSLAQEHYADLSSRPFFAGLVNYMTSGSAPVIAMVWEGKDVIKTGRKIIGATNPLDAAPGTIRGDLCISVGRNIIHGSDSFESAEKEIGLWFGKSEVFNWSFSDAEWVTADN